MAELPNFNQEKLPGIEELRQRVGRLEQELQKEASPEKKAEMVKKEIKGYLHEFQQIPSFSIPVQFRDEAKEIDKLEPNQKVGALISLVFEKGLQKAVSVARALENPAILDEFHGILIDRYYKKMVAEGIIKSI